MCYFWSPRFNAIIITLILVYFLFLKYDRIRRTRRYIPNAPNINTIKYTSVKITLFIEPPYNIIIGYSPKVLSKVSYSDRTLPIP